MYNQHITSKEQRAVFDAIKRQYQRRKAEIERQPLPEHLAEIDWPATEAQLRKIDGLQMVNLISQAKVGGFVLF